QPHLRRHVAGRGATEAREFRRVAEPPLRKASDETEGNHPGEDVLENLPSDEVREKRAERRSDPPNLLRTSRLVDSPPPLGDQSLHGPLDLLHPTSWVAEEEFRGLRTGKGRPSGRRKAPAASPDVTPRGTPPAPGIPPPPALSARRRAAAPAARGASA